MPWRRCRGRRLWRERIAPPYEFQDEFYFADFWPADVTSGTLLGWWRPEKLAAYADGASLTSWTDYSGNGRTATPLNPLAPVVKKATRNGLDVVRFAGTTDLLGFPHTPALLTGWTVFSALGNLDVATNTVSYAVAQTGAGCIVGGNHATYGYLGEFQDAGKYLLATTKPTAWGIDCWTTSHVYRDNTEVSYGSTVGTLDRFDLTDLGGRRDEVDFGLIGDLGEVLIYDAVLSDDERLAVHTYLKHRWNTP